jgi:hypothetical protein
MKKLLIILALCLVCAPCEAQKSSTAKKMRYSSRDVSHYGFQMDGKDTLTVVYVRRVFCFSKPMDMSRYWKLVRNFRKVYPLALVAREKMARFEAEMLALPTKQQQREFARRVEKELIAEYTPTLKKMTVSQGRILLRLIDRETDYTSFAIVKEFRGGFVAGFWQGVARLFGHNLKDEYDPAERDRIIEQCVLMYEAGLLPEY